jgi:hypothetical protein
VNLHRRLGCGLWLIWFMLVLFGGEWLLLSMVMNRVPPTQVPAYVFGVIILAIIGGWVAVFASVQRRPH